LQIHRLPASFARLTLAFIALALLVACASPTPYAPARDGEGYAEQQLERDRYRVSFAGNSLTPRETVENYLLYRAAEIALERGRDRFQVVDQETDKDTTYYSNVNLYNTAGCGPYPYYDSTCGGFGFGTSSPIVRYSAYANIILIPNDDSRQNDQTYNARDVLDKLGPTIVRPGAEGGQ